MKNDGFVLISVIVFTGIMLAVGPMITIWMINTLWHTNTELNFWTWLAATVFNAYVAGAGSLNMKK